METDEQDAYDLAVLLEDIERTLRKYQPGNATGRLGVIDTILIMFDKARMSKVIRYPQP